MDAAGDARSESDLPSLFTVVGKIDNLIEAGYFVPGQRLIESDIADLLSVSRGSVREALRFLAGDGVVEIVPNRGARVAILKTHQVAELFELFAGFAAQSMACLVARPISRDAKRDIRAAMKKIKASLSVSEWTVTESMVDYHNVIVAHCGNRYVQALARRLHFKHYARQSSSYSSRIGLERAVEAYGEATALLLKGDAQGACAILAEHQKKAIDHIKRS